MIKPLLLVLLLSVTVGQPAWGAFPEKIIISFERQEFYPDKGADWWWFARMPNDESPKGYVNYGWGLDFATCQDAYNGWLGSAWRRWIEKEGYEWEVEKCPESYM